jgi:hypothetical protein
MEAAERELAIREEHRRLGSSAIDAFFTLATTPTTWNLVPGGISIAPIGPMKRTDVVICWPIGS